MADIAASNHVARVLSVAQNAAIAADPRIAQSWRRCLVDHKLDPARAGPPRTLTSPELKALSAPLEQLIDLAMPEIESLYSVVREAGYCVNLADTNAVMLVSRFPASEEETFRTFKLYTGSIFAEAVEGTNGLGTCLTEQRAILVHRDEHFRQHWAQMSCAVAPVFDHVGRIAAAVNITSCRRDLDRSAHKLALAITVQATRRIEDAIFRAHFADSRITSLPVGDNSLVAFDDDHRLLGANRAARLAYKLSDATIASGIAVARLTGRVDDATRRSRAARDQTRPRPRDAVAAKDDQLARLAGRDATLLTAVRRLRAVADQDLPILLGGETGTGKEVFARAIHAAGSRAARDYVALNCAAMPDSLIDAELFGYEPGAFTGARRDGSKGLIVQADGGTLFLDEIGDMPLPQQTRLLRVLENREVWPLGALKPVAVDIRLISATHRDLDRMVREGSFRDDLYYRLRGLSVVLPPLRMRTDRNQLIATIAREEAPRARIADDAWTALHAHPFPGNMRELRHVLRLAAAIAENGVITAADLDIPSAGTAASTPQASFASAEKAVLSDALRSHDGDIAKTAQSLNISRATLYRKIKMLGVERGNE